MKDLIITAILIVLFASVIRYIIKEKKRGTKCIGCPHAKECRNKKCKT